MNLFASVGKYSLFIYRVFSKPEKWRIYYSRTIVEVEKLGVNSIGIVLIISVFMGAVITLQTAYNTTSPLLPTYIIGVAARDSILLEFSSTIVALILAGKVGSNISSEIGTMRITEQIDALEIMGVNSAGFLVMPKIIGAMVFFPVLTILSMLIGIFGGWLVGEFTGVITTMEYVRGIQWGFVPFYVTYSLIKSVVFAFIITSVSAFFGYHVKGGSLEVGKASTKAVVVSSILVLLFNLIITQLLLK
jgi:ABC-type transport system involved in resistance to organic solvents, permease component